LFQNAVEEDVSRQAAMAAPRLLVAGGTGIVGRTITTLLSRQGVAVRTLSRDARRADGLRRVAADVRVADASQPSSLAGLVDGIDVVISCLGAPVTFGGSRRGFHESDTLPNRHLLQAAIRAGARRFVYMAVHLDPGYRDTAYIRAHEAFIDELRRSPLSSGVVRCTGIFPIFAPMIAMARRGVIAIPGDGRSMTNPVHHVDVADMCLRAARGEIDDVAIGGPDVLTRDDICRLAFEAVGRPARIMHVPRAALLTSARLVRPFHPHSAEMIDFATKVFTASCVAPHRCPRRMADYFAELRLRV
jgi:uncharacterized protein YbjT (DUF2867 family)